MALVVLACLWLPQVEQAQAKPKKTRVAPGAVCRLQAPKVFLMRKSWMKRGSIQPRAHERALAWRAERYGHIPGLGLEKYNPESVDKHISATRFFGLPISIHEKIVPALACVERRIKKRCRKTKDRYQPQAIGGRRTNNTFRRGEVSNHMFGIAIDIDPSRNPCCHCVEPWPQHPSCQKEAASVYERTELPRCWIRAFRRYGFYWLGHDQLEDTMHFEFLGNPDRIVP
ncbi:M15 family metallopeptidase [Myxococcota bacterium]